LHTNFTDKDYFMENSVATLLTPRKSSFLPFEPTANRIKVSLHHLIDELLDNLQPLAHNRNNVIHNGVPKGLCFVLEENFLAYRLWTLLGKAVRASHNELIHVLALVDDHHTTIAVKGAGSDLAVSIPNTRLAF
jgi:signal transduction histidine kinase